MCDIARRLPTHGGRDPRVGEVIDGISGRIITGPTRPNVQLLIVRCGERVSQTILVAREHIRSTLLTFSFLFEYYYKD